MRAASLLLAAVVQLALLGGLARADERVSVNDLRFDSPGDAEFDRGELALEHQELQWEYAAPWRLTVESLDTSLGVSDDGRYAKNVSDLQFKPSRNAEWVPMTNLPQVIAIGESGRGTLLLDWRVLLDWRRDRPGRYRTRLRFTISAR